MSNEVIDIEEVLETGMADDATDIQGPEDVSLDFAEQAMFSEALDLNQAKYKAPIDAVQPEQVSAQNAESVLLGDVQKNVKTDADIARKSYASLIDVSYKVKTFILNNDDAAAEYSEILTQAENDRLKLIDISMGVPTGDIGPFIEIADEQNNYSQRYGNYTIFLKLKYTTIKKELLEPNNDMQDFLLEGEKI